MSEIIHNTAQIRSWLRDGGASPAVVALDRFEFEDADWAQTLAQVSSQHPTMAPAQLIDRAAYRLLQAGRGAEAVPSSAVPTIRDRVVGLSTAAWNSATFWKVARVLWALAVLVLLSVIAARAQQVTLLFNNGSATVAGSTANPYPVTCISGCTGGGGGGGTSLADEATFTPGTTPFTPAGCFFQTTPTNNELTNLQAGTFQCTTDRKLFTQAFQGTSPWVDNVSTWAGGTLGSMANYGTSPGAVLVPGVNAFVTNFPPFPATQPVSCANAATCPVNASQVTSPWIVAGGGTAGSAAPAVLTIQGIASMTKLLVTADAITCSTACEVSPTTAANTVSNQFFNQLTDGSGHGISANSTTYTSHYGLDVNLMGTLGTAFSTAGKVDIAAIPAGTNTIGSVKVTDGTSTQVIDPCQGQTKLFVTINQTGNTRLVTGTSAKKLYLCSFSIPPQAAAQSIALVEGTGSTCGTNTVALPGVTGGDGTAAKGAVVAINGGFIIGTGQSSVAASSVAADDTCLFQSGSTQLSGGMSYVVQ